MKKLSKILSLVLSIALVVTSITFTPTKADIKAQDFKFPHIITSAEDVTSQFYYSDDYFTDSSYNYNPHLATLSCCMASSAIGTTAKTAEGKPNYSLFDSNVKDFLTKAGFTSYFSNEDYTTKPSKDTIGYAFAKKTIKQDGKDYTLVAVNMRNAMYEHEWYNNFQLGTDGIHEGFQETGDKVFEGLENYIEANAITENLKIWITGYSRGAGIANYLGYKFDDYNYIASLTVEREDIFVYTFGTPNITTKGDYKKVKFGNIFNVFSPYDLVAKVVPEQWNWHRYGVDVTFPKASDDNYAAKRDRAQKFLDKMMKDTPVVADKVPGYKIQITGMTPEGITILPDGEKNVDVMIDDILSALSVYIDSSATFQDYAPFVDAAIDTYYDLSDEQKTAFINYMKASIEEIGVGNLILDILSNGDMAPDLLMDGLHEVGVYLENEDEVKAAFKQALGVLVRILFENIDTVPAEAVTIYYSLYPIVENHANFNILSWLQSFDSNYKLDSDNPPTPTPSKVTKPGKGKVTSAKRLSAKKIKVKVKKVKGAKGYQIKVYKGKKTYYKKYTKKTKITLKSKKFKKKKKLYVKVRAYKLDGKKKVFGKWSKGKKVKK